MQRQYVPSEKRGVSIDYTHVYSMDTGKCLTCGRAKVPSKRKPPIALAMTLYRGWRVVATPLRYKVQRIQACNHSPGGNPVWKDVQRMPRTRNAWVDQEFDCAMAMFERCFLKHASIGDIDPMINKTASDLRDHHSVMYVRQELRWLPRLEYCWLVLRAEWMSWSWWRHHYYHVRWFIRQEIINGLFKRD